MRILEAMVGFLVLVDDLMKIHTYVQDAMAIDVYV